jgi:hypothetical protein
MSTKLWTISAKLIGESTKFNSESRMGDFLVNNSKILGCWDEDKNKPTVVKKELYTKKGKGYGRIDIIGLRVEEGGERKILIFELKKDNIGKDAVDQLLEYLDGLKKNKEEREKASDKVLKAFQKNNIPISKEEVDTLLQKAEGVLVGNEFPDFEVNERMRANKLSGIRIMRFISKEDGDYYVVAEDIIGDILRKIKPMPSWFELIRAGKLKSEDKFYIKTIDGETLYATPWPVENEGHKCFVFDEESREKILQKRENASSKVQNKDDAKGLEELELLERDPGRKISPSGATRLVYLTHELKSGYIFNPYDVWKVCRTKKSIKTLSQS